MDNKVKTKLIQVWAVHQGADDRQCGSPHWWFSDESVAKEYAVGKGWYGGIAPVSKRMVIVIPKEVTQSGVEECYLAYLLIDLDGKGACKELVERRVALGKLTMKERQLLGLEEQ